MFSCRHTPFDSVVLSDRFDAQIQHSYFTSERLPIQGKLCSEGRRKVSRKAAEKAPKKAENQLTTMVKYSTITML